LVSSGSLKTISLFVFSIIIALVIFTEVIFLIQANLIRSIHNSPRDSLQAEIKIPESPVFGRGSASFGLFLQVQPAAPSGN
jgi:hypothetical protein